MAQLEGIGPVHTVFMASGQGSQKPGMGVSLFGVPEVQAALECASDVFDRDIAALVNSEGDEAQAQLNETRNAQVAIAALSIGIGRALMARGIRPDALLGFSLGQISALALADMLTDEEAFRLIDVRSRVMDEAARSNPGAMTALLKADEESVMALCEQCAQGDVLAPANFNWSRPDRRGRYRACNRARGGGLEGAGRQAESPGDAGRISQPAHAGGMRSVCGVSRDRRLQGARSSRSSAIPMPRHLMSRRFVSVWSITSRIRCASSRASRHFANRVRIPSSRSASAAC